MHRRNRAVAFFVLSFVVAAGCSNDGPAMSPVSGRVTVDGELPANLGTIHFVPQSGPTAMAEIQSDGTFELQTFRPGDGAVLGEHAIFFAAARPQNRPGIYDPEKGFLGLDSVKNETEIQEIHFPPLQYRAMETSGLSRTVVEGENTFDFDLKGYG